MSAPPPRRDSRSPNPPPRPAAVQGATVARTPAPPSTGERSRPPWVLFAAAVVIALIVGIVIGFGVGRGYADRASSDSATTPAADEFTPSPTPSSTSSPMVPSPVPSANPPETDNPAADAILSLAQIPVVDGYDPAPFDRAKFGQPWADTDRNGCDTRNDILGRDLLAPAFKARTNDCKVLSGTLIDPYDGTRTDFVSGAETSILVQIDHVVALGWSWHHGADAWSDERRTEFANDPRNLQASSEAMNQEKSAYGPSEWLPPVPELRCEYVAKWVGVLEDYDLGINSDDKAAAQAVLELC